MLVALQKFNWSKNPCFGQEWYDGLADISVSEERGEKLSTETAFYVINNRFCNTGQRCDIYTVKEL